MNFHRQEQPQTVIVAAADDLPHARPGLAGVTEGRPPDLGETPDWLCDLASHLQMGQEGQSRKD